MDIECNELDCGVQAWNGATKTQDKEVVILGGGTCAGGGPNNSGLVARK